MRTVEKELIKILRQEKTATAKTLSAKLEVSLRSVKNYVQSINRQFPEAIISSNRGYALNQDVVQKMMKSQTSLVPQTSYERIVYVENRLLNHDAAGSLNLYDLCDEIFVSYSTLKKEISSIKREIQEYDLELVTKGDEIKVVGSEKNKRKMLSAIIYKESGINFVNLQSIQALFPDINIGFIKATVIDIFDRANYFTNDYCLINLILHIAIAIDRIRHGNTNVTLTDTPAIGNTQEYHISCQIAHKLEDAFHIKYTESEIQYMVFLILSRATAINYNEVTISNLHMVIGKKCMAVVDKITTEICEAYNIDLKNPDFLVRFALHIKNLTVRCQNNHYSKNPFTQEIKTTCPLIFDMALHASLLLENKLNLSINDDETAYIALHLGSALEEQKSMRDKITAVLYCPNYYDMSLKMTDKINGSFSKHLIITNVINDEAEITQLKNIDLVISTIPLTQIINTPSICLSYFYSQKEEQRLSSMIAELEKKKRQNKYEYYLRQLIIPELFEIKNDFPTYIQVFDYMTENLHRLGYVDSDFQNEILERELLSTTAFGNFAIPHSMKMNAKKTGISVMISERPIDWNGHYVQLVLLMCFNKNQRRIFNEIYEPLTVTLSEPENVKAMIACKTYDDFIAKLTSMI